MQTGNSYGPSGTMEEETCVRRLQGCRSRSCRGIADCQYSRGGFGMAETRYCRSFSVRRAEPGQGRQQLVGKG